MAESKNEGQECEEREIAMPAKRKTDLVAVAENVEGDSVKKQRSEPEPEPKLESPNGNDFTLITEGRQITEEDYEDEEDEYYEDTDSSDEDDDDDSDDEEEEDGEEEDGEDEKSNGKAAVVDRKGKGILIEEEKKNDSDSDDSDLVEDPLAEVDLDNILPTKTRGGGFRRSGISISDNAGNKTNPN